VENATVRRLAEVVEQGGAPGMLVPLTDAAGAVPIHLLASGHGDAVRYRRLAEALGSPCAVSMLQPTWSGDGRPAFATLGELAERYAALIAAGSPAAGYLVGFSVAGITALETARALQARGQPVRGVCLVDTVAPELATRWARGWVRLFEAIGRTERGRAAIRRLPLGVDPRDAGLLGQVLAMPGHRVRAYGGPVDLIISRRWGPLYGLLFGRWARTVGRVRAVRAVPGVHAELFDGHNIAALAEALRQGLDQADHAVPQTADRPSRWNVELAKTRGESRP
jgi:thioesterase domain-containing protein